MFPADPALLFDYANAAAMTGWLALGLGVALRRPILRDRIAGFAIPLALATFYTGIVAARWATAEGGFGSLADVAALFASPWLLLAGWVHYLAYDLFLGAWIARDADRRGASRWLMVPVLPLAFLFGPAGFLLWIMIRAAVARRADLSPPART
jgi:hypothetical protein